LDFIKAIMGVVKTAAPIAANIVLPGSGNVISPMLNGLMDSVLDDAHVAVTPQHTPSDKAAIIAKNPELMAALEEKLIALDAKIVEETTKNMEAVNETIQAELKDGRWYQRAWRPFNGFMFPVAVLACYVGVPLFAWHYNAMVTIDVPQSLWVIWAGVLGVAVYGRNQEKQQKLGTKAPGLISGIMKKILK
jgi:hypothetical protein